ncbi:MAG: hypothetical protein U0637_14495 [Phycisphaerales bacterium]
MTVCMPRAVIVVLPALLTWSCATSRQAAPPDESFPLEAYKVSRAEVNR